MEDAPIPEDASHLNLMSTVRPSACRGLPSTLLTLPIIVYVRETPTLYKLHRIYSQAMSILISLQTVEIGLQSSIYVGSETDETTQQVCAVFLANPTQLVNGIAGVFNDPGRDIADTIITGTITPQMTGSAEGNDLNHNTVEPLNNGHIGMDHYGEVVKKMYIGWCIGKCPLYRGVLYSFHCTISSMGGIF